MCSRLFSSPYSRTEFTPSYRSAPISPPQFVLFHFHCFLFPDTFSCRHRISCVSSVVFSPVLGLPPVVPLGRYLAQADILLCVVLFLVLCVPYIGSLCGLLSFAYYRFVLAFSASHRLKISNLLAPCRL